MAYEMPVLINGARATLARKPGQWWRRRRSNAALIQDFAALKKCLMLCASCERKMPYKWQGRYGYRLLHNMHSEGACDYCRTYNSCNLFHHSEGGYVEQWDRQTGILQRAAAQQRAIRGGQTIRGWDHREQR